MGYCAPRSSPTHCHCLRLESRHCRPRKFPRGYLEQCDEQEDKALPSRNVPSLIFRSHTSFLLFYCPLCLAGLPDFQTMHTWSRKHLSYLVLDTGYQRTLSICLQDMRLYGDRSAGAPPFVSLGKKWRKSGHWCVSCHRRLAPGFLDTWPALVPVGRG